MFGGIYGVGRAYGAMNTRAPGRSAKTAGYRNQRRFEDLTGWILEAKSNKDVREAIKRIPYPTRSLLSTNAFEKLDKFSKSEEGRRRFPGLRAFCIVLREKLNPLARKYLENERPDYNSAEWKQAKSAVLSQVLSLD